MGGKREKMGKIKQVLYCNKTSRKLLVSYTFVELSEKRRKLFPPHSFRLCVFLPELGESSFLGVCGKFLGLVLVGRVQRLYL